NTTSNSFDAASIPSRSAAIFPVPAVGMRIESLAPEACAAAEKCPARMTSTEEACAWSRRTRRYDAMSVSVGTSVPDIGMIRLILSMRARPFNDKKVVVVSVGNAQGLTSGRAAVNPGGDHREEESTDCTAT